MKTAFSTMSLLALMSVFALQHTGRSDTRRPFVPDAALVAAIDTFTNQLIEGLSAGDFESLFPGFYSGFRWGREVTEIQSNRLFQVDYAVMDTAASRLVDQMRVLFWRPASPPGGASLGNPAPISPWDSELVHASSDRNIADSTMRIIETALTSVQMHVGNPGYYSFIGDRQNLSMVSRLPVSFPYSDRADDFPLRRVYIHVRPGRNGFDELALEHSLFLTSPEATRRHFILADNVALFELAFYDLQTRTWVERWPYTNQLPRLMKVTLGIGPRDRRTGLPQHSAFRIVAIPAMPVFAPVPAMHNMEALDGAAEQRIKPTGFSSRPPPELAVNSLRIHPKPRLERELEWLARSGVELAKYILSMESIGNRPDTLQHRWAGGPGLPDSPVAAIPLENYPLGNGYVSIRMTDLDRKININRFDKLVMQEALASLGVAPAESTVIIDSLQDWLDRDHLPQVNGAESDTYLTNFPPYSAKNGPIDHISELLLVRGVSSEMFFGPRLPGNNSFAAGLSDIFTATSSGRININTTTEAVLRALPGIDAIIAEQLLRLRRGFDDVDGTADDVTDINLLFGLLPLPADVANFVKQQIASRSSMFEISVQARTDYGSKTFVGLLRRANPRDIQLLNFGEQ